MVKTPAGRGARRSIPAAEQERHRGLEGAAPSSLKALTFVDGHSLYLMLSFATGPSRSPPELTSAERGVLRLLMDGKTNADIAAERGTSPRTVANQIAVLFRKFGVGSRIELAGIIGGRS